MPLRSEDIELHSEEVQEILGTPPKALVRWGITAVMFGVVIMLIISYLIEYPDVIKGTAVITTEQPPISVVPFNSGKIEKLYVNNQDTIQENEPLLLIENTAKLEDVKAIEYIIGYLDTTTNIQGFSMPNQRMVLGDAQNEYNNFISALNDLLFFYQNNFEALQIKNFQNQIKQYSYQQNKLNIQVSLLLQEVEILYNKYFAEKGLYEKGVISKEQLEQTKQLGLQKQQQYESAKISLSNSKVSSNELKKQISESKYNRLYKDNEVLLNFQESKDLLASRLQWWKKNYLVTAPISGQVSFFNLLSEDQYVASGIELLTVVPPENNIIGMVQIPVQGAGKVKNGQKVKLNLLNYPAQEFGYVEGKVKTVSLLPDIQYDNSSSYFVEVELTDSLRTSYNNTLEFTPNMQGTAEIITEKQKIMFRVLSRFKDLLKNKLG